MAKPIDLNDIKADDAKVEQLGKGTGSDGSELENMLEAWARDSQR